MKKFDFLLHEMIHDKRPSRRHYCFRRLVTEFSENREKVVDEVLNKGDDPLRRELALLLAEEGDSRGTELLAPFLEAELQSTLNDAGHWIWLSSYFDVYRKNKDVRVLKRFFPYIIIQDYRMGSKIIEAIRELKIKEGIPFLIKAAELDQRPHLNQEYALFALGEIGTMDVIEKLLTIKRNAGVTCQKVADEAIKKIRSRKNIDL
jgi:hypothetical protein